MLPIDPNNAILSATKLGFEKTWRPSRRWNLGLDTGNVSTQVQRLKSASINTSANPSTSATATSLGQAQPVKNLRITRRTVNGGKSFQVSVSFRPTSGDRFFQGIAVSLTQSDGTPLQVATGKESPVTFTVPASSAPSAITVQSLGTFGDTSLDDSPSRAISLTQRPLPQS